ncbi:MAG TPA: class I tRNA ligase family protein, partial [Saprospiraceae bacterium]|nr:class I tRNA ligase family protein [Saprospiraceae bacterium]
PYSPAAGTGLSSHELNMPGAYKEVKDTTVVALFKVKKDSKSDFLFEEANEDVRIAAWTTTPWTLPSNTALSAGPNIDYVKIKTVNPYTSTPVSVVMASELVANWFGGKNQPTVESKSESFKGRQMAGIRYEPLLDFGNPIEPLLGGTDAYVVLTGDHVTTADGTGIVHTAPSFGAEDQRVAKANGVGTLTLVDITGKFKSTVGPFSNRYIKDYKDEPGYAAPDIDIAIMLKTEGKALNVQKYEHNYPHCWRTDKPVMYYPLDSWFVKSTARRERMIELNKTINWKPAHTGEKRFGNWLENLQDWNLSRSRFWGIPLPIWRTDDGLLEKCIGSIDELRQEIEKANKALNLSQVPPSDLHRPFIDEVVLVSVDGRAMRRETDLIDVWFDSGSMPYAQWHYPFENQDVFKKNFPADFIAEGVDQTRGWFFTLHAIAVMVFDSVAFKNVVSNGLVLDKN